MKVFVISDTHFGHEKIIQYCNRPFETVEEMNRQIVKNWNNTVGKQDKVFFLGDFALKREDVKKYCPLLNGNKFLVKGNHDQWSNEFYRSCGFMDVSSYPIIIKNFLMLSHAPLSLSETTPYFNLYGHIHNDNKFVNGSTSKCVCVERLNYTPLLIIDEDGEIVTENLLS